MEQEPGIGQAEPALPRDRDIDQGVERRMVHGRQRRAVLVLARTADIDLVARGHRARAIEHRDEWQQTCDEQ